MVQQDCLMWCFDHKYIAYSGCCQYQMRNNDVNQWGQQVGTCALYDSLRTEVSSITQDGRRQYAYAWAEDGPSPELDQANTLGASFALLFLISAALG